MNRSSKQLLFVIVLFFIWGGLSLSGPISLAIVQDDYYPAETLPIHIDGTYGASQSIHINIGSALSDATEARLHLTLFDTETSDEGKYYINNVFQAHLPMSGNSDTQSFILAVSLSDLVNDVNTIKFTYAAQWTSWGYRVDAAKLVITSDVPDVPMVGSLHVDTVDDASAVVNGLVYVNGTAYGTAPLAINLDVGVYDVSFGALTGYTQPAPQTALVAQDQTTTVQGVYTAIPPPPPSSGSLVISTEPVIGAVAVDGVMQGDAPLTLDLAPGDYTVSYGLVDGYTAPADEVVTVVGDQITEVTGLYVAIPPDAPPEEPPPEPPPGDDPPIQPAPSEPITPPPVIDGPTGDVMADMMGLFMQNVEIKVLLSGIAYLVMYRSRWL